jgi:hypothetical protein
LEQAPYLCADEEKAMNASRFPFLTIIDPRLDLSARNIVGLETIPTLPRLL